MQGFRKRSALCLVAALVGLAWWAACHAGASPTVREYVEALARGADLNAVPAGFVSSADKPMLALPPASTAPQNFRRALTVLKRALDRAAGGAAGPYELASAYKAVWAADALVRSHFDQVADRLEQIGVGARIRDRLQTAKSAYLASSEPILNPLRSLLDTRAASSGAAPPIHTPSPKTLQAVARRLERLPAASAPPIIRGGLLPYRRGERVARRPDLTVQVQPAYLDSMGSALTDADRRGTPQAPLSDAILGKARALHYDPVAIYEFVRNHIDTEWYAGAMKGAEETLRQGRGNHTDQASLLIALLRAAQWPARYVSGVVEFPVADLALSLGLNNAARVPGALTSAGIGFEPVIRGGRLGAVQLDYTWVTTRVPYGNYRGAVVDFSGKGWVPLAPGAKGFVTVPAVGVLKEMAFQAQPFVDDYLSAPQKQDPLALLRRQAEDHLAKSDQEGSYEQQLGARSIKPEYLDLLPSSLPFKVVAVTGEAAALPEDRQHRVRLVARGGTDAADPVLLDITLPLAEVAGKRVTLSYTPATVEDHRTINGFGGLYNTPVYLIQVRPQLKIGGRSQAVAEIPMALGAPHRLEIELLAPWGRETVAQTLVAGSYHALNFGAPLTGRPTQTEADPADTERLAAQLLAQVAARFSERWDEAEVELAGLWGLGVVRPLPSIVMASNSVAIEQVLGLPYSLRWQGVTLDAALRVAEPVAGDTDAERDWMGLSALQGSALEHRVFATLFQVESISADKGLGLARQAGTQVVRLDADSVEAILPTLNHPDPVKTALSDLVEQGLAVEIPRLPTELNAWQGSAWRAEDPDSGAAGYFLSGGLAGGATTELPGNWVLDFLVRALAAPYSAEPNTDPTAAVSLFKLPSGDGQIGEVGEILPIPLAVLARDAEGRPVQGALVTFAVTAGGATLAGAGGAEFPRVTVATNALGIAEVRLRSGQRTAANPLFLDHHGGDAFSTQALLTEVEAWIARSVTGALSVDAPFNAIAYPGEATTLLRTNPGVEGGLAGTWVDSLYMAVQDRFDNPVSNVTVTFRAGVPQPHCDGPLAQFRNAVVFDVDDCPVPNPVLGECGASSMTRKTSVRGAVAGVILGNSVNTTYTLEVGAAGLTTQSYALNSRQACEAGVTLRYTAAELADEHGRNLNAARVGTASRQPLAVSLMYSEPDYTVETSDRGFHFLRFLPTRTWRRTTGVVTFSVSNGGSATPAEFLGPGTGTYQTTVTTGPTPGRNAVRFRAEAIAVRTPTVDYRSGQVTQETVERALAGPLPHVTGVDPRLLAIRPDPIRLDERDVSVAPIHVDYRIEPGDYTASFVDLEVFQDGKFLGRVPGTGRSGTGGARLQRGRAFDVTKTYPAELVLNRGSVVEIRSDPVELPLTQRIFRSVAEKASRGLVPNVTRQIVLAQEVDRLNNRLCTVGSRLDFSLTQPAKVTLTFTRIQGEDSDGEPQLGNSTVLIDAKAYPEGDHDHLILPSALGTGTYRFEFKGVSQRDGQEETVSGRALVTFRTRDVLPVGHAVVKGVDLWDGSLTVGREDLSLPGRGVPLAFKRTYASGNGADGGPLGVGWTHNYHARIVQTPCGEFIVLGGQGGGMRFVDDGAGGLRALKGYHGSLVRNPQDNGLDFYAKDGTRFHYALAGPGRWRLAFIEDTNHNRSVLTYDSGEQPKLLAVREPGGRSLNFYYARRHFAAWSGEVLTRVEGPEAMAVRFEYDALGNLIRAVREDDSWIEEYGYADPEADFEQRHLLTAVQDALRGARTAYAYTDAELEVADGTTVVKVPNFAVVTVTAPEGGVTGFEYDRVSNVQQVTDGRGYLTRYTLNRYGSPLRIEDPLGQVTAMLWATDDVVMTQRTDANGVVTDFDYDAHGNLLSETVEVTDVDGVNHVYTLTQRYHSPQRFDPPYIKNRIATAGNRNGVVTELSYDQRGNLVRQAVPGTDFVVTHRYADNGDRLASTDPNGQVTAFGYDRFGHRETVTDPLGGVTITEWNVRGLPVRRTDPLGGVSTFTYDPRGRLIRTVHPRVDGVAAAETQVYDDTTGTLTATDAEGRVTVTRTDREGRVVAIDNALGDAKTFTYDAEGNKIRESDWRDHATHFDYDPAGRLITRTEPLARITRWDYDGVGNVIREVLESAAEDDFQARITETDYDALNRRLRERRFVDGEPVVSAFKYDGEGNLLQERDPLERTTRQRFDPLNRLVARTDALGNLTTFGYDAGGNRILEKRHNTPADQIRRTEYDALNRVRKRLDAEGQATLFEYDAVGNRVREIDPRLNVVGHTYDARQRRRRTTVHRDRVSDLGKAITEFAYDRVGNPIEVRQPNGNRLTHSYDALNRPVATADSLGPLATYAYDANGNVLAETDANENLTQRRYDALNRLVQEDRPEGRRSTLVYDVAGNRLERTDPEGHTTRFEYDTLDRQIRQIDPAPFAYTTSVAYDAVGNRLQETDRRGNTTHFGYDAGNRLTRITAPEPLEYTETFTYDALGNRVRAVDGRGIVTETRYDRENRPVQIKRAGLVVETVEYDANGNRRFVTDANGNVTGFEYDERDLLIAENRPLAAISRFTLDSMGDRVEERDPEGNTTHHRYDLRRRLLSTTDAEDHTTDYAYDGNGNRTGIKRPEGGAQKFEYDGADRLVRVIDALEYDTAYRYDRNDNRLTHTDANANTTRFEYDALNRLTAKVYPDDAREGYAYDENGNRTALIDPKGQRIEYRYDVLDRETLARYPPPESPLPGGDELISIAKRYDPNGNLLGVMETYGGPTGTRETRYAYDDFDRRQESIDPDGKRLRSGFDANGNRSQLQDPDDRVTHYAYDAGNRLDTVTLGGAGTTQYSYFRNGLLKRIAYPNGTRAAYRYDRANRLVDIANTQHGTAPISGFEYAYDGNGNRLQQRELNGAEPELSVYEYDLADRLTGVVYPDRTVRYTYDGVGNRLMEQRWDADNALIGDKHYRYDGRNRLLAITDRVDRTGAVAYGYDANGNRTARTQGVVTTAFHYDARDRLAAVDQAGQPLGRYRYDYQGRRVWKEGGGENLRSVYDGKQVLLQTDGAGETVARYAYGPASRLLALEHDTEGRQFYLFDALGSVVNLIRADGALQARYQYDAWGMPRQTRGTSANPFRFTGHERDAGTGLYYFKARYYDPAVGTFLTEDPYPGKVATPLSLHRYLYAYGNPTVYIDPDGNVALIAGLRDRVDAWAERALESTEVLEGTGTLGDVGAALVGVGAFTGKLGAGALGAVNYAANWLSVAAGTEHAEGHAGEIRETHENLAAAVEAFADRDTRAAMGLGFVEQLGRAAKGDKQAVAELAGGFSAIGTGAVVPGGGGIRQAGSLGKRTSGLALDSFRPPRGTSAGAKKSAGAETTVPETRSRAVVTEEGVRGEVETSPITKRVGSRESVSQQHLSDNIIVIGRSWDTEVAKDWPGHTIFSLPNNKWSLSRNDTWVLDAIERRANVYIASPLTMENLVNAVRGVPTIFGREINFFKDAGYKQVGDYLLPPKP